MGFMQKQTYEGRYYEVETRNGTTFLPEYVCGKLNIEDGAMIERCDDIHDGAAWDEWQDIESALRDYVDGPVQTVSVSTGKLYRLSAPGYLDCTEWTTDPNSPEFDEETKNRDPDNDRAGLDTDAPKVVSDTDDMPGSFEIGLRGRVWRGWWYYWCSPRTKGSWCGWIRGEPYDA